MRRRDEKILFLAELIGDDAARQLCLRYGGARVYIPAPDLPHRKHRYKLLDFLEPWQITALGYQWGGSRIRVPKWHGDRP